MPQIRVTGEKRERIVHSTCVKKCADSTEQANIHQEGTKNPFDVGGMEHRKQ